MLHQFNERLMARRSPRFLKKIIIKTIKFLDNYQPFNLLFWEIQNIKGTYFDTKRWIAVETNDKFFLGTYAFRDHPLWTRIATAEAFEPAETTIVKKFLPLTNCFIDIGAHIGYYTCLVGTLSSNKIFSFEPNKDNYFCLLKNIAINRLKNVCPFNCALSDQKNSKGILYAGDSAGSIIVDNFKCVPAYKTAVKIDKLDNFISYFPKNSSMMVKIDTEASEYYILKGGDKFFKLCSPNFLIMEIVKKWGGGINPKFMDTFKYLWARGYVSFIPSRNGFPLKRVVYPQKSTCGSYIFIKKDKLHNLNI